MGKPLLCSAILFLLFAGVISERKITAELNPGCHLQECINNNIILVHVKAEGENDTLHHLWDFTGKPSLLLLLTEKNVNISVAWPSFSFGQEGAVTVSSLPKYIYGLVLDNLIEFNDEKDSGELDVHANSSYVNIWDTSNFNWKVVSFVNSSGDATLTIEANEYLDKQSSTRKNGTFQLKVTAYGGEEHGESLPHLLHSGNASQLELTLDGLATQFKSSRFGLQLITASSESSNSTAHIDSRKTLDDEHAPGIFTIVEIVTDGAKTGNGGGYVQWRPVVYTSPSRVMTNSTDSIQYPVIAATDPLKVLNKTLVYSTVGSSLPSMLVVATNVTFGSAGDGFYVKNKYATWTMLVGYGHPPEEQFSMLVTLVLLIGLGVPAVLILTGTVCIMLRRLQRNNDDLFLSR